jgi:GNAT superfamily N-acetyltransferase
MAIATRPLLPDEAPVDRLVAAAGPHGVYVQNALAAGEGEGFVLVDGGLEVALAWFGPRGNLVLVAAVDLPAPAAAVAVEQVHLARRPWRIAMGPAAIVDGLRQRLVGSPLMHRDQIYYRGDASTAVAMLRRDDVRKAERLDRDRLMQATLLLNQSDLNLDPRRVDRRWLRDNIDERIANGTCLALGPPGDPWCKLDIGSTGVGGSVIEGVFTFPSHRGKGLAAALVATCLAEAEGAMVLHVGRHNAPARSAYARAGMVETGSCRLLLVN